MKVSVITPTYNSERYILDCINSVINQTFTDWEYLIIDDCSTDKTVVKIESVIKKDSRIKLVKLKQNRGAAYARNTGIKSARGRYIAFLDSDDKWTADKLDVQISEMERNNLNFTYTDYYIVNEEDDQQFAFESKLDKVSIKDIRKFNYIACSTVVYNQSFTGKLFMPEIRNRQDWGLWINIIQKTGYAYKIGSKHMNYMMRRNSISSNKIKLIKYHWYIYRTHLSFSLIKSCYYLTQNIILHSLNKRA